MHCSNPTSAQAPQLGAAEQDYTLALPDSVLVHCLRSIDRKDRLSTLCLVSKRFHALCSGQELTSSFSIYFKSVQQAESLVGWLARHGRHLRTLKLTAGYVGDAAAASMAPAVTCCLTAAASVATQLESLCIGDNTRLCNTAWLPAMRALRHADLGFVDRSVAIPVGISCLTALRSLELMASHDALAPGATLPTSLSKLCLCAPFGTPFPKEMPPQFLLTSLQYLELRTVRYTAAGMHGLNRLSGLTRLAMSACRLPASLSGLTGLRQLELERWRSDAADASSTEELDALLAPLSALTCLMLWGACPFATPHALARLSQLQRCMLYGQAAPSDDDDDVGDDQGGERLPVEQQLLPAGPWLQSLRCVAARWHTLVGSLPTLHAAVNLDTLFIDDVPAAPGSSQLPDWRAFWRWAADHPPLRRLAFDVDDEDGAFPQQLVDDLLCLQRYRPSLNVYRVGTHKEGFMDLIKAS